MKFRKQDAPWLAVDGYEDDDASKWSDGHELAEALPSDIESGRSCVSSG